MIKYNDKIKMIKALGYYQWCFKSFIKVLVVTTMFLHLKILSQKN